MTRSTTMFAVATGLAGFSFAWLVQGIRLPAALPGPTKGMSEMSGPGHDRELSRLADSIQDLQRTVQDLQERVEHLVEREGTAAPSRPAPARPTSASLDSAGTDRYSEWTDDELFLVARGKGDDLDLIKVALRRGLPLERRAMLLLTEAAFFRRLEPNGESERNALTEAVSIAPATTAAGAQAAWELGNALASNHLQSQAVPYYEAVLRDAPDEHQRMQAAYRLAWRFDLGDDPPATALEAFKRFLAEYGEKWKDTPEAIWARHRVSDLEEK